MMALKINVTPYALTFGKKALKKALRIAGKAVTTKAKSLIGAGGGGPSKPGQAPNSRSGALKKSFKITMGKSSVRVLDMAQTEDGKQTFYARFLETGAQGGGRKGANIRVKRRGKRVITSQSSGRSMAARPFLTTAVAALSDSIQKSITQAVLDDIKGR